MEEVSSLYESEQSFKQSQQLVESIQDYCQQRQEDFAQYNLDMKEEGPYIDFYGNHPQQEQHQTSILEFKRDVSVKSSPTQISRTNCSSLQKSDGDFSRITPCIEIRLQKGGNTLHKRKSMQHNVIKFNGHKDSNFSIVLKQVPSTNKKGAKEGNTFINMQPIPQYLQNQQDSSISKERKRLMSADNNNRSNYTCMLREMKNKFILNYRNRQQTNTQSQWQPFAQQDFKNPFIQNVINCSKPSKQKANDIDLTSVAKNQDQVRQQRKQHPRTANPKQRSSKQQLSYLDSSEQLISSRLLISGNSEQQNKSNIKLWPQQSNMSCNNRNNLNYCQDNKRRRQSFDKSLLSIQQQDNANVIDCSLQKIKKVAGYIRPTTSYQNSINHRDPSVGRGGSQSNKHINQPPTYSMVNFNEFIPSANANVNNSNKNNNTSRSKQNHTVSTPFLNIPMNCNLPVDQSKTKRKQSGNNILVKKRIEYLKKTIGVDNIENYAQTSKSKNDKVKDVMQIITMNRKNGIQHSRENQRYYKIQQTMNKIGDIFGQMQDNNSNNNITSITAAFKSKLN